MIMPSATTTARIPVVKARQSRAGDFKSRASVMFTSVEISPSFAFHRGVDVGNAFSGTHWISLNLQV